MYLETLCPVQESGRLTPFWFCWIPRQWSHIGMDTSETGLSILVAKASLSLTHFESNLHCVLCGSKTFILCRLKLRQRNLQKRQIHIATLHCSGASKATRELDTETDTIKALGVSSNYSFHCDITIISIRKTRVEHISTCSTAWLPFLVIQKFLQQFSSSFMLPPVIIN